LSPNKFITRAFLNANHAAKPLAVPSTFSHPGLGPAKAVLNRKQTNNHKSVSKKIKPTNKRRNMAQCTSNQHAQEHINKGIAYKNMTSWGKERYGKDSWSLNKA